MRKFYIQNSSGQKINLNDKNSYFFSSPTGLGSTRTVTYNTDGSGFADVAESNTEQINIVGEIIITRNPYSGYRSLADFLIQSERLVLRATCRADDVNSTLFLQEQRRRHD